MQTLNRFMYETLEWVIFYLRFSLYRQFSFALFAPLLLPQLRCFPVAQHLIERDTFPSMLTLQQFVPQRLCFDPASLTHETLQVLT